MTRLCASRSRWHKLNCTKLCRTHSHPHTQTRTHTHTRLRYSWFLRVCRLQWQRFKILLNVSYMYHNTYMYIPWNFLKAAAVKTYSHRFRDDWALEILTHHTDRLYTFTCAYIDQSLIKGDPVGILKWRDKMRNWCSNMYQLPPIKNIKGTLSVFYHIMPTWCYSTQRLIWKKK